MSAISHDQKEQITRLGSELGLRFVVLFGSHARRSSRPDSDIDLAIMSVKKPSHVLFLTLFTQFSSVFKGHTVDIRFLNDADPLFAYQVIKDGVLVYGDIKSYNSFKVQVLNVYIDGQFTYVPYLEKLLHKNQRQLERNIHGS